MESALLTAPPAFASGCKLFNELVGSNAPAAAHVVNLLVNGSDPAEVASAPSTHASSASQKGLLVNSLVYVLDNAKRLEVDAKLLAGSLRSHSDLSLESIDIICREYTKKKDETIGPKDVGTDVSLLGVDWSIGVTTKTSTIASTNEPFINLRLRLHSAVDGLHVNELHLSMLQFAALEASIRSSAVAIDKA